MTKPFNCFPFISAPRINKFCEQLCKLNMQAKELLFCPWNSYIHAPVMETVEVVPSPVGLLSTCVDWECKLRSSPKIRVQFIALVRGVSTPTVFNAPH